MYVTQVWLEVRGFYSDWVFALINTSSRSPNPAPFLVFLCSIGGSHNFDVMVAL